MKAPNSVGFSYFKTCYIESIQIIGFTRRGVGAVSLFTVWGHLQRERAELCINKRF